MTNRSIIFILILFTVVVFLTGFNIGKGVQRIEDESLMKNQLTIPKTK